jgi:hypothetical protein
MRWLERHAWWGLLFFALVLVLFGITDMAVGPAADVAIPVGLTGMTPEELQAESAAGYRLFDFFTRVTGWGLVMMGLLATAVLLFAFRKDRRWAWWTMWLLPIWSAGVLVFYLVAGVQPGEAPPPPMISGPIFAVLGAAILLVSAPRFFRRDVSSAGPAS